MVTEPFSTLPFRHGMSHRNPGYFGCRPWHSGDTRQTDSLGTSGRIAWRSKWQGRSGCQKAWLSNQQRRSSFLDKRSGPERTRVPRFNWLRYSSIFLYLQKIRSREKAMKASCAQDGFFLSFLDFLIHVDTRTLAFTATFAHVISGSPFVRHSLRVSPVPQRTPKSM